MAYNLCLPARLPARPPARPPAYLQAERIRLDQVIAVGDGANDLHMLNQAGLGIAFNAKRIVQENSKFSINQKRMDTILYLLGIKDEERAVAAQNRDFFTY